MAALISGRIIGIDAGLGLFAVWFQSPNLITDFDIAVLPDGCAVNDIVWVGADGKPAAPHVGAWTERELAAAAEGARQLLDSFGWP